MNKLRLIPDCVPCIIRPVMRTSYGLFSILKPSCQHINPNIQEPVLIFDYFKIFISFLYTSTIVSGSVLFLLRNFEMINSHSEQNISNFDSVFEVANANVGYFTINFYFLARRYKVYSETLCRLVSYRNIYGIESLLPEQEVRKFLNFIKLYKYFFILQMGLKVMILFMKDFSFQVFVDDFGNMLAIASGYYLVAQILLIFSLYCKIISYYMHFVETALTERSRNNQVMVKELRQLRLFYVVLCKNYKCHIFCFGNLVYYLVLFLTSITLGVLSYGAVSEMLNPTHNIPVLRKLDFVFLSLWFWVTFLMFCDYSEQITHSAQDLLSYLYRYPISKLTQLEAAEVEMLIMTLTLEKPELRASNIFTVGTNLISSITGNVVTYVLVALQFHAFFSK